MGVHLKGVMIKITLHNAGARHYIRRNSIVPFYGKKALFLSVYARLKGWNPWYTGHFYAKRFGLEMQLFHRLARRSFA